MKFLADHIYFLCVIFEDTIIGNTPVKFGEKMLTFYGTVLYFVIFPKHFYY